MKVIIKHYKGGSGKGGERNEAWLEELRAEHEAYYAQHPVGDAGYQTREAVGKHLFRLLKETEEGGHRELIEALIMRLAMGRETSNDAPGPCGGWMTSAGNLTLVVGEVEVRLGRRHGLRQAQETVDEDRVHYLETMRPGANPDVFGL